MISRSRDSSDAGYSLVEVLVAFLITTAAITVFFDAAANSSRIGLAARDYLGALSIARSRLDETTTAQVLNDGALSGIVEGIYHWRVAVEPVRSDGHLALNSIFAVRVAATVNWTRGLKSRSLTLSTVRLWTEVGPSP